MFFWLSMLIHVVLESSGETISTIVWYSFFRAVSQFLCPVSWWKACSFSFHFYEQYHSNIPVPLFSLASWGATPGFIQLREPACRGLNPYIAACWLSQEALTTNYLQPFSWACPISVAGNKPSTWLRSFNSGRSYWRQFPDATACSWSQTSAGLWLHLQSLLCIYVPFLFHGEVYFPAWRWCLAFPFHILLIIAMCLEQREYIKAWTYCVSLTKSWNILPLPPFKVSRYLKII